MKNKLAWLFLSEAVGDYTLTTFRRKPSVLRKRLSIKRVFHVKHPFRKILFLEAALEQSCKIIQLFPALFNR